MCEFKNEQYSSRNKLPFYDLTLGTLRKQSISNTCHVYFFHRPLSTKIRAPPPPKKLMTCNPEEVEIDESDIPSTFSSAHRRGLLKKSRENAKEPQALMFRKLADGSGPENQTGAATVTPHKAEENKPLTQSDEQMLKTFYGMFYTNENSGKDWKLEVDGFIPVCFVQSLGNINKPFKIIAVQGSVRVSCQYLTAFCVVLMEDMFCVVLNCDNRESNLLKLRTLL